MGSRRERCVWFYYYVDKHVPEESYLSNRIVQRLKISPDNRRFANWHTDGAHPLDLTINELPAILESGCHFARKISLEKSSSLLTALDRIHKS